MLHVILRGSDQCSFAPHKFTIQLKNNLVLEIIPCNLLLLMWDKWTPKQKMETIRAWLESSILTEKDSIDVRHLYTNGKRTFKNPIQYCILISLTKQSMVRDIIKGTVWTKSLYIEIMGYIIQYNRGNNDYSKQNIGLLFSF